MGGHLLAMKDTLGEFSVFDASEASACAIKSLGLASVAESCRGVDAYHEGKM